VSDASPSPKPFGRTVDARRAGLYRPSHNDAGTNVTGGMGARSPGVGRSDKARVRRWALVALVAQVAFVASWLIAASWQGPRYSVLVHSISDMYAVDAPNGAFLVVVFTLCGAATILFAVLSLWPSLRPGGWRATVGTVLLGLSIYGLGDLLSPFEREACQLAEPGCETLANLGGKLDAALSTLGLVLFVAVGFFLASAMQRVPGWRRWAWPARWATVVFLALLVATVLASAVGLDGLFERLLAASGAAGIALLAAGVLRRSRA
jgi:Protein of unknown function (DUF998)